MDQKASALIIEYIKAFGELFELMKDNESPKILQSLRFSELEDRLAKIESQLLESTGISAREMMLYLNNATAKILQSRLIR